MSREGFPLSFTLFEGNTFEGNTLIPVILEFKKKHGIKTLTVVADAAMISRENVQKLTKGGFSYIVGARLANCSPTLIAQITSALGRKDATTMRIATDQGNLEIGRASCRERV